jgi:mannose-6-phosphate isomerase-like protein (cupin superfamily)
MKSKNLEFDPGFRVVLGNETSQAAEMVLPPGKAEGNPENRHRGADQWLYVLSGIGIATVNDKHYRLAEGSLILIERGDRHEIRNTGDDLLRTLNFYVPPAYTNHGDELPSGRAEDCERDAYWHFRLALPALARGLLPTGLAPAS